jgi:hypothetical protein
MDVYCGWFMDKENEGLGISATTLRELGVRGIELSLETSILVTGISRLRLTKKIHCRKAASDDRPQRVESTHWIAHDKQRLS